MNYSLPVRLRVEKDKVIRVIRTLKGKGTISVNVGQQVTPEEIIGRAAISSGFRTLNLSTLLGVSSQEVEKYLTRKLGQRIYKDELLAEKKGGFLTGKKMVVSPTDGILDFLNNKTGELKITFLPRKADLPAGCYGIVEDIDNARGQVIIRTLVSQIYGIFGSGRSRDGILHVLGKKDNLISKQEIQTKYDGQILIGGGLFFKETISAAISIGVSGMITGGINAEDYKDIASGRLVFPKKLDNDIGISIVVCEGFGSIPIADDIFGILSEYEGKFIFIDGNKAIINLPSFSSSSLVKVKNTKLPPLQDHELMADQDHLNGVLDIKLNARVRIIGNSYLGEQGKIISIDESLSLLPSGIKTYLATIETDRRKIQVPFANLEIIR